MADGSVEPKRTGASLNRHGSNPNRGTPRVFLDAVERRFGPLDLDLAATAKNSVTGAMYFGPDQKQTRFRDSLKIDWAAFRPTGNLWLNPPFSNIAPWAKKCASVKDRLGWTLLLVPDSRDSNWYLEHIHGKSFELPLNGRVTFVGETVGFPKPLTLYAFGFGVVGEAIWRWDTSRKWRVKA